MNISYDELGRSYRIISPQELQQMEVLQCHSPAGLMFPGYPISRYRSPIIYNTGYRYPKNYICEECYSVHPYDSSGTVSAILGMLAMVLVGLLLVALIP